MTDVDFLAGRRALGFLSPEDLRAQVEPIFEIHFGNGRARSEATLRRRA